MGAGSCTQPPARRPTVTAPGGTAPGKRIEGRRCARRTAAISSLSPPKGPRRVARDAAHRPRRRKNRPGDRTGARSSCVALAHPKRRGSASIRPAPRTACARRSADWPRKTMEASDTAAAVEPQAGIRREMQAPPGKLVLLIVSTVFGALLIRRLLHRPIVPAWVGKEAEANHGNSSLSETSTLIGLRLDRRQASPTVLGDQLGKIG